MGDRCSLIGDLSASNEPCQSYLVSGQVSDVNNIFIIYLDKKNIIIPSDLFLKSSISDIYLEIIPVISSLASPNHQDYYFIIIIFNIIFIHFIILKVLINVIYIIFVIFTSLDYPAPPRFFEKWNARINNPSLSPPHPIPSQSLPRPPSLHFLKNPYHPKPAQKKSKKI